MDKRLLENHQKKVDEFYDFFEEDVGLFYSIQNRPDAYHTKITQGKVHFYMTNADRMVALFDSGRPRDIEIGLKVVDAILAGQCKKEGATFGLWPYFYEESLEEMDAPDWNMADFNGINLLQLLLDYEDLLGYERTQKVKQACHDACRCIMHRDVTITYTNVTIMDIYMTLVFGERYDEEILAYGKKKLKRFYHLVMNQQSFEEHSSPTYSVIVVDIIGLMLQHVKDADSLLMINELNDLEWSVISEHYHPKTGEWAGPMSRAYANFLDDTKHSFFEKALDFKIKLCDEQNFGLMDMRYDVVCPEKYVDFFTNQEKTLDRIKLLSRGFNYPYYEPPRIESLYISKDFTLGSFCLCGGWHQHKTLMAHFGDKQKKYCMHYRVLHNLYDFCSGFTATLQKSSTALSVTNFHTNRGDTHNDLDKVKNATISANDLRVRYQVEANTDGIIDDIEIVKSENGCKLTIAGVPVEIGFDFAEISGLTPYFEIGKDGRFLNIDMVFYSGDATNINLNKLDSLVGVSHLVIGEENITPVSVSKDDEFIYAKMTVSGKELSEKCVYKPLEFTTSVSKTEQWIDGESLERIGEKNM